MTIQCYTADCTKTVLLCISDFSVTEHIKGTEENYRVYLLAICTN